MKRLRGIAWAVVALLVAVTTVVVVQTFRFRPAAQTNRAELRAGPAIDVERAVQRLAEAIRFRTVSAGGDAARDDAQWHALHAWLAQSYPGVHATLQREQIADLTLLYTWPGSDPMLAPRSRKIVPELVLDEGFMVLADFPLTGRPAGVIGVAEKGYLTLKLTAPAVGGHSSMPPRNSGAVRLARAIVALEDNQLAGSLADPPIDDLLRAVATDMPWLKRMVLANRWLFARLVDAQLSKLPSGNALMRTTTAPTMLSGSVKDNVLPQAAHALVNFRIHPRDSIASVTAHVRAVVAPFEIEVTAATQGVLNAEPSPIAPTDTHVYRTLEALAGWVGQGAPVAPGLVLGGTDSRHFATLTPAAYRFMPVIGTPEEIAGFHGTDERLSVANVGRMVEGYARLLVTLAGAGQAQ